MTRGSHAAAKLAQIEHHPERGRQITLLELVAAISEATQDEQEVIATVAELINSDKIELVGNFKGADVKVGWR